MLCCCTAAAGIADALRLLPARQLWYRSCAHQRWQHQHLLLTRRRGSRTSSGHVDHRQQRLLARRCSLLLLLRLAHRLPLQLLLQAAGAPGAAAEASCGAAAAAAG